MFDREVDYPTAIASYDAEGVEQAIRWSIEHMQDGDTLTVWTSLKSNLKNCAELERLISGHRNVQHVAGRGGGFVSPGPVLMAWADMNDVAQVVQYGSRHIRALCVITWAEKGIRPWVGAVKPTILGDGSVWEDLNFDIHPVVVEALEGLTLSINHNNTIRAGYEKDQVVSAVLALHGAGIPMDAGNMQGWALAHGWSGGNPEQLAKYVRDIQAGKPPRSRNTLRHDYVAILRQRVAASAEEN